MINKLELIESKIKEDEKINEKPELHTIWKKAALNILLYVKKFIGQMKSIGSLNKFKKLNKHLFSIIDDNSVDF